MLRHAIAIIVLSACAPALPNAPSSTLAGATRPPGLDDHRTTHPTADLTCKDEIPTGTLLERRKCRSDAEREQDREVVRQTFLNPASRVGS